MLVFDVKPLIYLAKTKKINLLEKLEEQKVITEKVYQEVVIEGLEKDEPDAERIKIAVEKGIFEVRKTEKQI